MYLYETHLHTKPVSGCGKISVRQAMTFYKMLNYDGIILTNHFIDDTLTPGDYYTIDENLPYEERIQFYFSDYEEGKKLSEEIGIKVFCGIESSYLGTDFLVYGLDKEWFLAHPEIEWMPKSKVLPYYMEHGALVVQAHPFREGGSIDHIRLFPRCVHGVEIVNACRSDFENESAKQYAAQYGLLEFAGSDNHGYTTDYLGGMQSETPIETITDFVKKVKEGEMQVFAKPLEPPFQNARLYELEQFQNL